MVRSGLLFRAALWLLRAFPATHGGQMLALVFGGIVLTPLVPLSVARVAAIAPLTHELARAFGYAPRSKGSASLAFAGLVGYWYFSSVFLTGLATNFFVVGLLSPDDQRRFGWFGWLTAAAPVGLFCLVGALVVLFVVLRAEALARSPGRRVRGARDGQSVPLAKPPGDGAAQPRPRARRACARHRAVGRGVRRARRRERLGPAVPGSRVPHRARRDERRGVRRPSGDSRRRRAHDRPPGRDRPRGADLAGDGPGRPLAGADGNRAVTAAVKGACSGESHWPPRSSSPPVAFPRAVSHRRPRPIPPPHLLPSGWSSKASRARRSSTRPGAASSRPCPAASSHRRRTSSCMSTRAQARPPSPPRTWADRAASRSGSPANTSSRRRTVHRRQVSHRTANGSCSSRERGTARTRAIPRAVSRSSTSPRASSRRRSRCRRASRSTRSTTTAVRCTSSSTRSPARPRTTCACTTCARTCSSRTSSSTRP